MEELIDLHTHTRFSDGELSPEKLIELAKTRNIKTIAITDHDTVNGIKKIRNLELGNIEVIKGIELSAKATKGTFHILGYDLDLDSEILNNKMWELKTNSTNSTLSVMEQIKRDYGIRFDYDDIKKLINANRHIGRPDLAKLCIKYGYATTPQEAFDKYLNAAHEKIRGLNKWLTYEECLDLIIKSGGIPVLAHPYQLKMTEEEFIPLLENMIKCGLRGIEVYHSNHSKEQMEYYKKIANKYDLLISGGSDYHGKILKPDIELGTGKNNNLKLKQLSLVDEIHKRR
ncbi:MAG: PHP domain-containing protein [Bacilli bacterium]|nr:PHP domain-containing protein [Bacilli bacterium]